jgi:thiamine kinase-like enzyme
MGNISNLTLEMKQTQNISSELRVKRVTLPENLEIYRPEEMAGNNNGVLIMRYANGISLAEYIEDLELEEKLKILKRVVEGNAKSSSFGMSRTEEDRLKKAHTDLENNKEIKNEVKNKIRGNLDVLLKFSNVFSSVYDRDGHAENAIVTRNENIVLIDFEVRLLSDPVYMLVKLIEHSKCFGYDEEGFKARKLLISEHFKNIGIEKEYNDTKINEAHYFSSVPLKALSYHSFSYGKNRKKTRTNYLMAANFALDVLLKEYGELYTKEERNKLKDLKYCMQAMPL